LAWDAARPTGEVLPIGRVVKVDAGAGRITIEHKPIWRLYMEAMTMTFRVSDPAMLTGLTPGDRIRFKVERAGDGFVVHLDREYQPVAPPHARSVVLPSMIATVHDFRLHHETARAELVIARPKSML
jgi:Cu/Ag efflux protein CusF